MSPRKQLPSIRGTSKAPKRSKAPSSASESNPGPVPFIEYRCPQHGSTFWHRSDLPLVGRAPWCSMCWVPFKPTGRIRIGDQVLEAA